MSLTLSDLLTSLAYRLGEDSSPTDASEKARRVRFINEGYRKMLSTMPIWFSISSTTFNSVLNQETYDTITGGFPADYRDMIELRVDDDLYTNIPDAKLAELEEIDDKDNIGDKWYVQENILHILPAPETSGTNNISMKYFKYPTLATSDSSTFIIPDFFTDALVAYAYARISQMDDKRGDASDGFNEFNEILQDLVAENNRQKFYNKSVVPSMPFSEDAD